MIIQWKVIKVWGLVPTVCPGAGDVGLSAYAESLLLFGEEIKGHKTKPCSSGAYIVAFFPQRNGMVTQTSQEQSLIDPGLPGASRHGVCCGGMPGVSLGPSLSAFQACGC